MADSRFAVVGEDEIQKLKAKTNTKNANTIKSTQTWLNVWRSWAEERKLNPNIEENPPEILDEILQRFYAEVRNKNGDHYEPESLRVMIASLDRHLRNQKYPFSIIKDGQFQQSKQVLDGRTKLPRKYKRDDKGKRPSPSNTLSMLEEEDLWEKGKLGSGSPRILCQTMLWIITKYFGLRGREVHYSMNVEDFNLCKDDGGVEYIILKVNPTKIRQRGFGLNKLLATTGGPRCLVGLFKEFLSRRPPELSRSGPFYLAIINKPQSAVWYKTTRLGINSIDRMIKTMTEFTYVAASGKGLANHSAKKNVQRGKVKAEASSPQKLQVKVVGPAQPKQQTPQAQKKFIVHQPNGQKVILTPVTSQPAQNITAQVVRDNITTAGTPVGTPVNQIVKTIAAPTNTQNTKPPGLCIVKVVTHGSSVPVNTKPILATPSNMAQTPQIKVDPSSVLKVGGSTVTNTKPILAKSPTITQGVQIKVGNPISASIGGSQVPKVGGPPVMLKVNSQAAAKHVANLPTMVPMSAVVVDSTPKVVSVQSLAAPEQNYSIPSQAQQVKPVEVKPQVQPPLSNYKPLESLIEVNKHAAESSISPVSAVVSDSNTSTSTSPTLGRKDVTVNDRYRYIAPSGKTPIGSHTTTNTPAAQGVTPAQVKLETPTQMDATPISVKTETQQSASSPLSKLKRSHNGVSEAEEPPRKKPDSSVIIIDPPSPPKDKDTITNVKPIGTDIAVTNTMSNTNAVNADTNFMDDASSQEHKVQPNADKNIPNIDKSIVDTVKEMSPQQQFKALLSRTQQLYELRANVCKLLRVLVPELEVDDRQENFEDQTVDELLQQVLEQAETSEAETDT